MRRQRSVDFQDLFDQGFRDHTWYEPLHVISELVGDVIWALKTPPPFTPASDPEPPANVQVPSTVTTPAGAVTLATKVP